MLCDIEQGVEAVVIDLTCECPDDFCRLNVEWLERWFSVEPVDEEVLGDPERHVLADGGHILFAITDGTAVGTVALRHEGGGVYELTKMAVAPDRRGGGIGRALVTAALDRFVAVGGRRLILESNDQLEAAIALYESVGFVHRPAAGSSPYGRANVWMEWQAARAT